jgi:hypothetical protein
LKSVSAEERIEGLQADAITAEAVNKMIDECGAIVAPHFRECSN